MKLLKSAVVLASVFALSACATMPPDSFPDPGHVFVKVTDQNGAGISGVTVQILAVPEGIVWRSAVTDASGTAAPGEADGGILPRDYSANVILPQGYSLLAPATNPVPITVQSNKRIDLTFTLKTGP